MDMSGATFTHSGWGAFEYMWVALWLIGPVGLFVLRRHLAEAKGFGRVVKAVLIAMTAVSIPVVGGLVIIVLAGGWEAADTLWDLVKQAW